MTTVERLKQRTAERLAAGLIPEVYPVRQTFTARQEAVRQRYSKSETCIHLAGRSGEYGLCDEGCGDGTRIPLQLCTVHGKCSVAVRVKEGHVCCKTCPDYSTVAISQPTSPAPTIPSLAPAPRPNGRVCVPPVRKTGTIRWAYGVTTVKVRRNTTLPRTLASLAKAGFDAPRLFVDGDDDGASWRREFGLDVTARGGAPARTAANWCLSLAELYGREPNADRYAIFQDDLVTVCGLREYLDATPYPTSGYWNLYTFPENAPSELREKRRKNKDGGLLDGATIPPDGFQGFYPANQLGRGAVALVFDRTTVVALLTSPYLVVRPQDVKRGHRAIDGGIVEALRSKPVVTVLGSAVKEYVHAPSLVQHIGAVSAMGNRPHPSARDFPGEEWDAKEGLRN